MSGARHPSKAQLPLPFLDIDDVCAIDAACGVVEHQAKKQLMAGRAADAERTFAIADNLRAILERHAAAHRQNSAAVRST